MTKFLILLSFLIVGCTGVKSWQIDYADNVLEEMIEKIIEEKYGHDLDLTPLTGDEKIDFDIEEYLIEE